MGPLAARPIVLKPHTKAPRTFSDRELTPRCLSCQPKQRPLAFTYGCVESWSVFGEVVLIYRLTVGGDAILAVYPNSLIDAKGGFEFDLKVGPSCRGTRRDVRIELTSIPKIEVSSPGSISIVDVIGTKKTALTSLPVPPPLLC